jgi:uncharacterized protein YbaA (DUF1428 family)
MAYIDGFVTAVPIAGKQAYIDHVRAAAPVFKEHGALRIVEAWGDDVPAGKVTDFRRAVQAQDEEAVLFSWIEWPSREIRDEAMRKVLADSRILNLEVPFDGKRMIFGGFQPIFDE